MRRTRKEAFDSVGWLGTIERAAEATGVRPRRDPPELHVIVKLEAAAPAVRILAETHEDELRLRCWLARRPGVLLAVGDIAWLVIADVLAIEGEGESAA
jgi:hypothetical protein